MIANMQQIRTGALIFGASLALASSSAFAFGSHSSGSYSHSYSSSMSSGSMGSSLPMERGLAGRSFGETGIGAMPASNVPGTTVGTAPNGITTTEPSKINEPAKTADPATTAMRTTPTALTSTMAAAKKSSTTATAKPNGSACDPKSLACAEEIQAALQANTTPPATPAPVAVPAPAQAPEPAALPAMTVPAPAAGPALVTESSGGSTNVSTPGGAGTLAECMAIWDRSSDMSKVEWRDTCQRTLNGMDLPEVGLGDTPGVHHVSHSTSRAAGHHSTKHRPAETATTSQ